MDIALAHGVRHFETAGYAPGELIGTLHAAGAVVIDLQAMDLLGPATAQ